MRLTSGAQQSPWFISWFDSAHYYRLYANRNTTEAAAFIDELIEKLRPRRGALALDLGCGVGRHSRYLAAKGFCVTGIDLAAGSIKTAKQSERPGLQFLRQDMRVPFGKNWADYVFNFFTSFGYFDNPDENLAVVRNMADCLKPGGRLVLDYLNAAHAEMSSQPTETRIIDGFTYQLSRWSDSRHLFKRIAVENPGGRECGNYSERVARFSLDDFSRMFNQCGLSIDAVFGDYGLAPYDPNSSPRLILLASKPLPRTTFMSKLETLRKPQGVASRLQLLPTN
jgi:SAM-dependent methyltransferase